MRMFVSYVAGVATGWVLRSAVGSTRGLVVSAVAVALEARDRTMRILAQEREFLEDLVAEGRARYAAARAQSAQSTPRAVA